MAQIDGGDLVARMLKGEGIDGIFTLSGGHVQHIYDGCIDEGIRVIDTRHEQSAGHAAEGYGRLTRNCLRDRDRPAVGQILVGQEKMYGEERVVATRLGDNARYDRVVEALGGHGEFVTEAGEIFRRSSGRSRPASRRA